MSLFTEPTFFFVFYIYLLKLATQHSPFIIAIEINLYGIPSLLFYRSNSLWWVFVWKWRNMYCYIDCVQRTSTKMFMSAAILWSKMWKWYEEIILNTQHFHFFVLPCSLKCSSFIPVNAVYDKHCWRNVSVSTHVHVCLTQCTERHLRSSSTTESWKVTIWPFHSVGATWT